MCLNVFDFKFSKMISWLRTLYTLRDEHTIKSDSLLEYSEYPVRSL